MRFASVFVGGRENVEHTAVNVIHFNRTAGSKSYENVKRGETSSKVTWSVCLSVRGSFFQIGPIGFILCQLVTIRSREKPFVWKMFSSNRTENTAAVTIGSLAAASCFYDN